MHDVGNLLDLILKQPSVLGLVSMRAAVSWFICAPERLEIDRSLASDLKFDDVTGDVAVAGLVP